MRALECVGLAWSSCVRSTRDSHALIAGEEASEQVQSGAIRRCPLCVLDSEEPLSGLFYCAWMRMRTRLTARENRVCFLAT